VAGDSGKLIQFTSSSAVTFTIADVLAIGQRIEFVQSGAGTVTFSAGTGVTLQAYASATKLAGQHAWGAVVCVGTATYGVLGNFG
jgi:hypothetical protein